MKCPECGADLRLLYTTEYGTEHDKYPVAFDFYLLCMECDYEDYKITDEEVEMAKKGESR